MIMDYEKKYKQAIKKIRKGIQPLQDGSKVSGVTKSFLEEIFPELAESDAESEDEKIRKALIEYFNEQCDMSDWNGVYGYQVVAWLEKQGEKKPQRMISAEAKEAMYDKPAWSEEDEEELFNAVYACLNFYGKDSDTTDWLKSLKQRIGG